MNQIQIKWKLLITYLAVIAVCIGMVIIITRQLTLSSYSQHLQQMAGGSMGGMMSSMTSDLNSAFRKALNEALIWGGLAAIASAVAVSLLVSRLITNPIHEMAGVTRRIASGDFSRRVEVNSGDELGSLAQSLNQMAASLETSEEQRRELMANVAHELRTPLSSISGYMEGLADGVVPADKDTFDLIQKEAGRLSRLVNDLQRLSRAESGEERLDMVVLDLGSFLARVGKRFEPQFENKGVLLDIEITGGRQTVNADEDKLDQIIINLLDNALSHTQAGDSVSVYAAGRGKQVEIRVSDTGTGISKDDLPHIFERFYRADKSRSRESGGSGIGLTITRSYVEAMGGEINVESMPDSGTTFTILLPSA